MQPEVQQGGDSTTTLQLDKHMINVLTQLKEIEKQGATNIGHVSDVAKQTMEDLQKLTARIQRRKSADYLAAHEQKELQEKINLEMQKVIEDSTDLMEVTKITIIYAK